MNNLNQEACHLHGQISLPSNMKIDVNGSRLTVLQGLVATSILALARYT